MVSNSTDDKSCWPHSFIVQLRKTQIPKTLFDKISDFSWNTGYLSVWQVLGHYYYSTGDVASFQGFFLKQKRVERDETYHKCGSRTVQEPNSVSPNTG